jgi:hypothetical protein
MKAERLHAIVLMLKKEINESNFIVKFQNN